MFIKAGIAQLVEHNLAKVGVASSNLVSRSKLYLFIYSFPGFIHVTRGIILWVAS